MIEDLQVGTPDRIDSQRHPFTPGAALLMGGVETLAEKCHSLADGGGV